jgi:hypothetical protein
VNLGPDSGSDMQDTRECRTCGVTDLRSTTRLGGERVGVMAVDEEAQRLLLQKKKRRHNDTMPGDTSPVRLAYQPPASSTFLSQQTSHQQPASSTLLSEQTSTSHQPPANRTG